jgi:hypothetical protein
MSKPYIPRCERGHKLSGENVYVYKRNIGCRKCDNLEDKSLNHYQRNKDRYKNQSLLWNYGITLEEYNKLFEKQKGRCAICHRHQSKFKKALHTDHDHKTDIVRGLLCQKCNHAIGLFGDSPTRLIRASRYLEKSK